MFEAATRLSGYIFMKSSGCLCYFCCCKKGRVEVEVVVVPNVITPPSHKAMLILLPPGNFPKLGTWGDLHAAQSNQLAFWK